MSKPWNGVLTATATPFKADLSIDYDKYAEHVSWLAANGTHGVIPNGSLGEYQVLTQEERSKMVEVAIAAAPKGFNVVPGVAAYGAVESRRWAEHAQKAGAAPWDDLVWQDFHVAVYRDRFPVTQGHLLFVPKYNTPGVIADALRDAVEMGERMVASGECEGYNVGINQGRTAGQTVMYPHVHLIPRRTGDCADPTGGVRGVIFGQQNYKATGYQQPE